MMLKLEEASLQCFVLLCSLYCKGCIEVMKCMYVSLPNPSNSSGKEMYSSVKIL